MSAPGAGFRRADWYADPHAYDIVFDVDTAREADFLEGLAARHARSRGRRALEPACGSGRLVAEMARRGWRVAGNDRSAGSLAYARRRLARRGLAARLFEGDMAELAVPGRFDLAYCLVSTFKYLLEERAARRHLRRVAELLAPGGIYVLGFHLTDYASTKRTRERWVAERGGVHVVCNIQSWPPDRGRRLELVRSRLVVRRGARERRSETLWRFRTYDEREVRALLAAVPALEHVATHDFHYELDSAGDLCDGGLDKVFVLRRRAPARRPPAAEEGS